MLHWETYGFHKGSPRTIYGAISGPPLPQMIPFATNIPFVIDAPHAAAIQANLGECCGKTRLSVIQLLEDQGQIHNNFMSDI